MMSKNKCVVVDSRWTHHLPDLHDVVLRHGADDPGFIGVPGEVRDLGCVAPVDELKGGKRRTLETDIRM